MTKSPEHLLPVTWKIGKSVYINFWLNRINFQLLRSDRYVTSMIPHRST